MTKSLLRAAILGGSGYTGSELLRLLLSHPHVKVTAVTSERSSGFPVSDIFLNFRGTDLNFELLDLKVLSKKADVFFLCLPHKTSQETAAFFYNAGKKVIDLSADYRIKDPKLYREWYNIPHLHASLLKKAVYGLPEIYRKQIKRASLIANPGCYPVSAILALAPVIDKNFVDADSIIIDSKSGTSGAGRTPSQPFMYCEVNESVRAYAVTGHRHTPEIEQELSAISKKRVKIIFTPHLMPMDRGMLSTVYVRMKRNVNISKILKLYQDFYRNEPFVRVLKPGVYPNTKAVKGSNFCDLSLFLNERNSRSRTLTIVSVIDNLIKGASGSAVQNMNIMYGFDETAGLLNSPPCP